MHIGNGLRRVCLFLICIVILAGCALSWCIAAIPDTFYIADGSPLTIASMPFVRVRQGGQQSARAGNISKDKSENCTLALFGAIPIKTVRTVSTERRTVQVSGIPFGIKLFSSGALVVAFSDQYTVFGLTNPAKEAGLRLGDLIVSANGKEVRANEELTAVISEAHGNPIHVVFLRNGTKHECTLTPVADKDTGVYKAGIWVRDSSAGIGTLTFSNMSNHTFAGLGHSVSDMDTGADIRLLSGEITPVVITGCVKGTAGIPGELRGDFLSDVVIGIVKKNESTGVYGVLNESNDIAAEQYPVAEMQEIEPGPAQIITTILGSTPKKYNVVIERVNMTASDPNRNMLVRITDAAMLNETGGIVQGMSGSPIIQNGRLIGAVTHVLVNNPARGYAIFAQTMLHQADSVA